MMRDDDRLFPDQCTAIAERMRLAREWAGHYQTNSASSMATLYHQPKPSMMRRIAEAIHAAA